MNNTSFFGGVIYIDLRGYTKIVEEKILENIAEIIYDYQEIITKKVKSNFLGDEVVTIEYMGDGVLIILNGDKINNDLENNNDIFALNLFKTAKVLSNILNNFLEIKKQDYTDLENIDFGIGLSCSRIYQKNIFNKNNLDEREMFFGISLNRAAKIGDKMSKKYNHIAIDKKMYDNFLINSLTASERQRFYLRKDGVYHMCEI